LQGVLKFALSLCALLILVTASTAASDTQIAADRLSHVKKLYVDSLGTDRGAAEMRAQMIRRLQRSRDIQVVSDPGKADAVVKGTGRTWLTGQISLSPRSHSVSQPMFDGFLSVEIVDKKNETLWSYLVSPSKFAWNGITADLVSQMVTRMLSALKSGAHEEPPLSTPVRQIEGTLHGAGATFPAPLYQRWFELFQESHPNVHVSYDAVGSAEGIERLREGKTDFGASEMALSDKDMSETHQHFQQLPTALGAVVVIYNLKGFHQILNFTPETLAAIYLGKITKWNDPRILESNRGAALPDAAIIVVHRSDGSGTTFVWSDYLSKVSPDWKTSVGSGITLHWPVGTGAEHNEGVASAVQRTPNSIGYVEFIYAIQHELSFGAVRNASGQFVKASIASVTAAAGATADPPGGDFRVSINNAPGKESYPIATYTWLLFPDQPEADKKEILTDLLRWMLTTGQKNCSAMGYVPLPAEVAKRALKSLTPGS